MFDEIVQNINQKLLLCRFTLKHSMLRHRKKHGNKANRGGNNTSTGNSASDMSDEESQPQMTITSEKQSRLPDLINKDLIWKLALAHREQASRDDAGNKSDRKQNDHDGEEGSDLIGKLLGISDQGILNKLLSSADEAAKLLGVKNNE